MAVGVGAAAHRHLQVTNPRRAPRIAGVDRVRRGRHRPQTHRTTHEVEEDPLRRLVVIATVAATTAALALTVPTAATAAPAHSSTVGNPSAVDNVAWSECSDPTLQAFGAVCGVVEVPVDYSKPHGKKLALAVSMVR